LGGNSTPNIKIFRIKKKLESQQIKEAGNPAEIYLKRLKYYHYAQSIIYVM